MESKTDNEKSEQSKYKIKWHWLSQKYKRSGVEKKKNSVFLNFIFLTIYKFCRYSKLTKHGYKKSRIQERNSHTDHMKGTRTYSS